MDGSQQFATQISSLAALVQPSLEQVPHTDTQQMRWRVTLNAIGSDDARMMLLSGGCYRAGRVELAAL